MKLAPEVKTIVDKLDVRRTEEAIQLMKLMRAVTGEEPKAWQGGIIGFGSYHYRYDSGREGDWLLTGFSVRKTTLSIYIISGFEGHQEIMKILGKYKTGKSCLYVKNLSDIDLNLLEELVKRSVVEVRKSHHD